MHGGLSPEIRTIDQIRTIDRRKEIPHEGKFCDLVWSDPDDCKTWAVSPRGAGWLFGELVTDEFNRINNLSIVCRAHQLVQEGYKFHFPKSVHYLSVRHDSNFVSSRSQNQLLPGLPVSLSATHHLISISEPSVTGRILSPA